MLFRTVYGPELQALYNFIKNQNHLGYKPEKHQIYQSFIPQKKDFSFHSTQSIDDALHFLLSAKMIEEVDQGYWANEDGTYPFSVQLLKHLRCLETGKEPISHPLDPLFLSLITDLFINPDRLFLSDLHSAINHLPSVRDLGGLGREKIQAWMRVMEFLRVGRRVQGQFLCLYHPELILQIFEQSNITSGTLQDFFQRIFGEHLPFVRKDGDIPQSLSIPLLELQRRKFIFFTPLQDSPTRPYFGTLKYRGFTFTKVAHV